MSPVAWSVRRHLAQVILETHLLSSFDDWGVRRTPLFLRPAASPIGIRLFQTDSLELAPLAMKRFIDAPLILSSVSHKKWRRLRTS